MIYIAPFRLSFKCLRPLITSIVLLISTSIWAGEQAPKPLPKLEGEHLEQLLKGEMITLTSRESGQRWPKVDIINYLNVPPTEAFAIFADFNYQRSYIPNLERSEVTTFKGPSHIEVSYRLKLPWPLSNSNYVHVHQMQKKNDGHYQMTWQLVESDTTEAVYGQVDILSTDKNGFKSMLVYQNLVTPQSGFARLFRNAMVADVEKSLKATIKEIERVWKSESDLLKNSMRILNMTLNDQNPY